MSAIDKCIGLMSGHDHLVSIDARSELSQLRARIAELERGARLACDWLNGRSDATLEQWVVLETQVAALTAERDQLRAQVCTAEERAVLLGMSHVSLSALSSLSKGKPVLWVVAPAKAELARRSTPISASHPTTQVEQLTAELEAHRMSQRDLKRRLDEFERNPLMTVIVALTDERDLARGTVAALTAERDQLRAQVCTAEERADPERDGGPG